MPRRNLIHANIFFVGLIIIGAALLNCCHATEHQLQTEIYKPESQTPTLNEQSPQVPKLPFLTGLGDHLSKAQHFLHSRLHQRLDNQASTLPAGSQATHGSHVIPEGAETKSHPIKGSPDTPDLHSRSLLGPSHANNSHVSATGNSDQLPLGGLLGGVSNLHNGIKNLAQNNPAIKGLIHRVTGQKGNVAPSVASLGSTVMSTVVPNDSVVNQSSLGSVASAAHLAH